MLVAEFARFEVLRDNLAFEALQGEWDDLFERTDQARFSQSFTRCWAAWKARKKSNEKRLHCIVGRCQQRTIGDAQLGDKARGRGCCLNQ